MSVHSWNILGKFKIPFVKVNNVSLLPRDWPISSEGSKHDLQRKREKRMRNMADVEVAVGDDLRRKPYSMASLDNDWYAVLGGIQRDLKTICRSIP